MDFSADELLKKDICEQTLYNNSTIILECIHVTNMRCYPCYSAKLSVCKCNFKFLVRNLLDDSFCHTSTIITTKVRMCF